MFFFLKLLQELHIYDENNGTVYFTSEQTAGEHYSLEYNASSRALRFLKNYNYVSASELKKAKKLLSIAAQTYIVGLFDGLFVFNKKRTKK